MHEDEHNAARTVLGRLPVFSPDPALWTRVVAARQRVVRRRQVFAVAAAAAIAVAALLVPRPLPPLQQDLAGGLRESRALESEWRQVATSQRGAAPDLIRLRVIDAELQAAYDRGAAAGELAPLWRERNQALRGLIARVQDPARGEALAVTRI
jgi:hypothetical protein